MDNPVHCGSHAWVTAATELLEALVAELGSSDHAFRVCEIFTDARKSVSATGKAAWHFFIEGQSVKVGLGEAEGSDVTTTSLHYLLPDWATPEKRWQNSPSSYRQKD